MACRVYKYSLIISIEKQANCFYFYWITAYCWFIKFQFTFSNQKQLNLKSQIEAEVLCSRPVKCRDRTVAFTGRCEETGSDWQLSVLLAELFCKWWWRLSDNVGWDERRRANAVLSSEEIQFRSINIDMLLSPTEFALRPLVWQIHAGLIYTPPRLWYSGVKQQMARPLAPWNFACLDLALFFSFSVTWLLFLFAFHGCYLCRSGNCQCHESPKHRATTYQKKKAGRQETKICADFDLITSRCRRSLSAANTIAGLTVTCRLHMHVSC